MANDCARWHNPYDFAASNLQPKFRFELGQRTSLSGVVLWPAIDMWSGDPYSINDEAKAFTLEFYKQGNLVGTATVNRREPVDGKAEEIAFDRAYEADRVEVTITENFGGNRVTLGQIRFVGQLLGSSGNNPLTSLASPVLDAAGGIVLGTPALDQRGAGHADSPFGIDVVVTKQVGNPFVVQSGASANQSAVGVDVRGTSIHVFRQAGGGLAAQRVTAEGTLLESILVSSNTSAANPQIVVIADGDAIIVWGELDAGHVARLFARRFKLGSGGLTAVNPSQGPQRLTTNVSAAAERLSSVIAIPGSDAIVVTWDRTDGADENSYIGQFTVDKSSGAVTPGFQTQVAAGPTAAQRLAVAAAAPDGNAVRVAWVEGANDVYVGSIDPSVGTLTDVVQVPAGVAAVSPPSATHTISAVRVATTTAGELYVGWRETTEWTSVPPIDGITSERDTRIQLRHRIMTGNTAIWQIETELLDVAVARNGGTIGEQYGTGVFTPIDLRTGLADPLEFGKLESVSDTKIRYISVDNVVFVFAHYADAPRPAGRTGELRLGGSRRFNRRSPKTTR